ncbi:unnamed protein product [Urochloa decumbens]|uniref:Bifunctional inhibitor/plant lipid transfer protein/seed storage helical domain-containing protein n=1 Tax=Urochloa decumbens TaxID=240449 RepID=A0ABC8WJY5_9POAL
MSTGAKAVAVLLVVVCAFVCNHQAADAACTLEQKKEILSNCMLYLEAPWLGRGVPPWYTTRCCVSVKKVPGMDMQCILNLCTEADKKAIVEQSLLKLKGHCSIWHTLPAAGRPHSH